MAINGLWNVPGKDTYLLPTEKVSSDIRCSARMYSVDAGIDIFWPGFEVLLPLKSIEPKKIIVQHSYDDLVPLLICHGMF